MYPVSFYEFVKFNDATLSTIDNLTTKKIGLLKGLYAEYMLYGGIPEYLKYKNKIYMHDLYESILYKDIIARYKIPDPTAIKKL